LQRRPHRGWRLHRAVGGARAHGDLFPLLPADAVVHRPRQRAPGAGAGGVVMKRILALLLALPALAFASGGGVQLDHAPVNLQDRASLQRGAAIFVNHCLNCHSASAMRYARLEDLGLNEAQIRDNLMLAGEKIGETMTAPADIAVAKAAFGVVPPDLSLVGRSRGADWLYSYLRSFYRDPKSKTGWNNTVFPNVAMPHVLGEFQGVQDLEVTNRMDPNTGD